MKIFTSYYSQIDNLISYGIKNFYSISGTIPSFYESLMKNSKNECCFYRIKELSPKKEWFYRWKKGEFDNNKYVELYNQTVLSELNPNDVISKIKDNSVLLCYESSEKFCHRHIVAEWLKKELNIEIKEFTIIENLF
jgi:uncharacterized protein (DUF488 family)